MSKSPPDMNDYDAIAQTVQHYIDGARAGSGEVMKQAFHDDAAIFGYGADGLFAAPIQQLFDRVDITGPAPETRAKIVASIWAKRSPPCASNSMNGRGAASPTCSRC